MSGPASPTAPSVAPVGRHLLPDNHQVGDDGSLSIGGCSVTSLAEEFGTPLFIYDEAHLRARCREAVAAYGPDVAYATKAFLCTAMAQLAHEEGMRLDVATGGELFVPRAAGVPADRLVFHGNNKSEAELAEAIAGGIGCIVVDSGDELARIDALVRSSDFTAPRILLRITPGVEAHTHEYVQTGQADSKFGFGLQSGAAAQAAERALGMDTVELVGFHAHIGSQVFTVDSFMKAVDVLAGFVQTFNLPELSLGGGLGVAYTNDETAPTITEWAGAVLDAARAAGITATVSGEPGRSIAAAAAITVYRVGTIKDIPGVRTFLSVDGGMSDNPRPVLYGSGYEAFLPRAVDAPRERPVRVVGKHCESGDFIVREAQVPADTAVGDLLATPVTGAYGHSMASNYNKVTRPPVVFAADGDARIVVRRETYEDLTRLDALLR